MYTLVCPNSKKFQKFLKFFVMNNICMVKMFSKVKDVKNVMVEIKIRIIPYSCGLVHPGQNKLR